MWYFAWLLGLPVAAFFAVLNAMWFEMVEDDLRNNNGNSSSGSGKPAAPKS